MTLVSSACRHPVGCQKRHVRADCTSKNCCASSPVCSGRVFLFFYGFGFCIWGNFHDSGGSGAGGAASLGSRSLCANNCGGWSVGRCGVSRDWGLVWRLLFGKKRITPCLLGDGGKKRGDSRVRGWNLRRTCEIRGLLGGKQKKINRDGLGTALNEKSCLRVQERNLGLPRTYRVHRLPPRAEGGDGGSVHRVG